MHPMLQNVLNTAAPEGTAVLWWMGQMGLWIRMGNTTVSVDYYAAPDEGRQTPPPVPAEEVAGIDAFLGTRKTFADIAATCAEWLGLKERFEAESFAGALR